MNGVATKSRQSTIVTRRTIAAPVAQVWKSLKFYEEIKRQPPLLLRLFLPRPRQAIALSPAVGHETTLQYDGGYYARRVTTLDPPRLYEFEVVDQQLAADRGVRFEGGAFALAELAADRTELAVTTRYRSGLQPRWLARPVEAYVCRRLQAHLLDAIEAAAGQH